MRCSCRIDCRVGRVTFHRLASHRINDSTFIRRCSQNMKAKKALTLQIGTGGFNFAPLQNPSIK